MTELTLQTLVCLGTAHVLGDLLFQRDPLVLNQPRVRDLIRKALVVAGLSYLLCGAWQGWWIPVTIFSLYSLIDALTARVLRNDAGSFLLDQSAHMISIVVIAFAAAQQELNLTGVHL